jgi:methylamine dehydrogenase accessory protein MauD
MGRQTALQAPRITGLLSWHMVEALLISNLILWITVLVLAAVVVALVRQVGVLHERVSPAGALVGRGGPTVGEAAPQLAVVDWSGRPLTIGGADADRKSTLLVFISPSCPVCKTMLSILDAVMRTEEEWLHLILASDGARDEHDAFVRTHGLADKPYVLSSELGLRYQVPKLPYGVLIDADGVLRAKGLVNTREHIESLFEAMRHGVGSVQEYLRRAGDSRHVA